MLHKIYVDNIKKEQPVVSMLIAVISDFKIDIYLDIGHFLVQIVKKKGAANWKKNCQYR